VGNVTLHGFGRGQTVYAPLANVTVFLSDVDCENVNELPIMCAVTDFCSRDYDVILPAAVLGNLQAKAVLSKGLCNGPTVRACVDFTTADRLSNGTKMGTAVGAKPRSDHTDGQPKRNLGGGMSHWAYAVAMFCILCVALIVCVALMSVIDNCDVMFARVLTPAPVMLSCLLPSQRIKEDKIAHIFRPINDNNFATCSMSSRNSSTADPESAARWCITSRPPTGLCDDRCDPPVRQTSALCRGRGGLRTV